MDRQGYYIIVSFVIIKVGELFYPFVSSVCAWSDDFEYNLSN